ncbi:WD40-repeat-containing domain protein [Protomyces lactucae-debilis]|uniref:WD40-repeat-containing domain protein n=1 Tax=Protomyces lactucae-debilis TaxID=2754530 RepID=A0A1Y2EZF4_PROLT|nr:WD40-repeat-containing domain protein [Protomyces lactucae-debilis]ORY77012.1 WD40-repeat-containing domain protein [Protomyces lactucae-debilis]
MNSLLADPFAQDYPETLLHTLPHYQASCIRFCETHLAAGTLSGDVILYDLLTLAPARILRAHSRTIQSLCWSRCGRYLLSASRDWLCVLWDLQTATALYKVMMGAPVWMADLHPIDPFTFCASLLDAAAVRVSCSPGKIDKQALEIEAKAGSVLCSLYTPAGEILGGSSKGQLLLWSSDGTCIRSWKLTSGSIKGLSMTANSSHLVSNSTDRVIRTFAVPGPADETLEIEHKFQDIVNRLQWNAVCFSGNAEYVAASTYQSSNDVYLWERQRGSLVKILEGPKEELIDVAFHPTRVLAAAVGVETGTVYLWGVPSVEKWGSFAPDFKELEENVEFVEQEDAFDIRREEETGERRLADESASVDLEGDGPVCGFLLPLDLNVL